MSRKTLAPERSDDPWSQALHHFHQVDPRLFSYSRQFGTCALRPAREPFATLIRSIVGQRIAAVVARRVNERLFQLLEGECTPQRLASASVESLRSLGLTPRKVQAIHALAEASLAGRLDLESLATAPDEEVIDALIVFPGIGRWTAEMFLIFALCRPDVLPVGDFGIRAGLRLHFQLEEPPRPKQCAMLTEHWRPYRSVAMWYLWRLMESQPRSTPAALKSKPITGGVEPAPGGTDCV